MAVDVASPFALNILTSPIELPQHGGTFVAGRIRRINHDPYGGDGFVWEDMTAPREEEQKAVTEKAEAQEAAQNCPESACATASNIVPEQRSVATKRLDQLKRHLLDIIPLPSKQEAVVEGFSLDNIHIGIGQLQDWQAPRWSGLSPALTSLNCNHEWQDYAQRILFGPEQMQGTVVQASGNHDYFGVPRLENSQRVVDIVENLRKTDLQARGRVVESLLEPVDVHCNSWSSLMAHRRRRIADVA